MLARQSEIRYKNGKADPCGRLPILYISLESERNKRPENWQCSPPAENKKSARRDSNFKRVKNIVRKGGLYALSYRVFKKSIQNER